MALGTLLPLSMLFIIPGTSNATLIADPNILPLSSIDFILADQPFAKVLRNLCIGKVSKLV